MKYFQMLGVTPTVPLAQALARQGHLWREDTYLRDYPQGPFGDCETVFLRFPPASVTELEQGTKDQHESVWMDGSVHLPEARKIIFDLMALVSGERLGRVMINKLRPGGRIYPHADTPAHAQYWERYHVVLESGPGCLFKCGDEAIEMKVGEVWWFDHRQVHEVLNNSRDARIHLIIDIRTFHIELQGLRTTTIPKDVARMESDRPRPTGKPKLAPAPKTKPPVVNPPAAPPEKEPAA